MATSIKIKIRRGSTADWTAANPILALGEIGADMDKHRLKVGDGVTSWNGLAFCPVIVNDLTTGGIDKALSAEMGKNLKDELNTKADQSDLDELIEKVETIENTGGVTIYDDLDSYEDNWALSANMGRKLNEEKADKSDLEELQNIIESLDVSGGVTVLNNLTSTSTTNALSANMGRELNEKLKGIGIFGILYGCSFHIGLFVFP